MARLGDLYQITSGGTPSRKHLDYYQDGTIPWVKTGDLKEKYLRATDEKITEIGLKNSSARIYPKDTVLIAMYGATIGASSILKIEAATNQACAAFVKRDDVIPEYLYAFLESQQSRFIEDAVGGAQPNISAGYLKQVDMPLIPVEEQRRIAALLDKVSDLIAKRRAQLDKLDLLVKARFVEMFGDPVKNDKGLPTMMGQNFFKLSNGKFVPENKRFDKGIPAYGGNGISWYTDETLYEENTIVVGRVGFQSGNVHFVKGPLWITDNAMYISNYNTSKYDLFFLYVLMEHIDFTRFQDAGDLKKITQKPFMSMEYIMPTLSRQREYVAFAKQIDKSKLTIQQSLDKLETLKKALMQQYFG